MPYKQYTHCTDTADFDPLNQPLVVAAGLGGLVAMIVALFVAAAVPVAGIVLVLAGGGFLLAAIVSTFEYLLGGKLICLGGDKLAIGSILSVEPASSKSGMDALDNDLSINLLLCPHEKIVPNTDTTFEAANLPDIDTTDPLNYQDFLTQEQAASSNHGIPYTGYESAEFAKKPNFHIELEGSRIYDMYNAFLAAWALLVAFAIAAAAVAAIPVIGWLLALLLMLFGAVAGGIIAGATWAGADDGATSDIDPAIGELHINDVMVSYGTWTYDSGHNADLKAGWNESHPVKFLSKADGCVDQKGAADWEDKIKEALRIPDLRGAPEKHPLIGSVYHPMVDGCEPKGHAGPPIN